MSRVTSQRTHRLGEEKKLLDKNFDASRVRWIDPEGETKVEVNMISNNNNCYTLRLYIPDDFPNSCPMLVVVTPEKLLHRNGTPLLENCRAFHTLGSHDGFQVICHFHPADWNDRFWLFQVFMKGRLWIEAYEGHLDNGESLDHYLRRHRQSTSESSELNSSWSLQQIKRLRDEKQLLEHFYPDQVKWSFSNGDTTVDVQIKTKNENSYKLRVYLPSDFPNSCPTLAVVSPPKLQCENGEPLPDNSKEFRTLAKKDGKVTICHFSPSDWTNDITIGNVFTKGEIWVKAYESYITNKGHFLEYLNKHVQSSD